MATNRDETKASTSGCGCSGPCGGGLGRREFLEVTGLGLLATSLAGPVRAMAGPFDASGVKAGHLVPADKRLAADWVRSLFERGVKEVYSGKALDKIGMPCGGIGSGQLYLCGDGTLGSWQIANNAASNWVEGTSATYAHEGIAKPIEQRFEVTYTHAGQTVTKPLSKEGFANISFRGEYPLATVTYEEAGCPIRVVMEAFSPFIPLSAHDSGLPATVFQLRAENLVDAPVVVTFRGVLENAVCKAAGAHHPGTRFTRTELVEGGAGMIVHGAAAEKGADAPSDTVVFADFEGDNYGGWEMTGDAFGKRPAKGTLPNQQEVVGYEGKGLVNTFLNGDVTTGTLTSPEFTIEKSFINLLVGGGLYEHKTCVQLLVNGQVVEEEHGANTEQMHWTSWYVDSRRGQKARIRIVDEQTIGWGHILVDQVEFSDEARKPGVPSALERAGDFGSMALVVQPAAPAPGEEDYGIAEKRVSQLTTAPAEAPAGEAAEAAFVLAWHFPNQRSGEGHYYASNFKDAGAVARYVTANLKRLGEETRAWRDAFYDSTLPYWLLDRLHSTVSTLATGTCEWWGNGRFYAFEGVTCCAGTCTHVWNYAHTHARLFPAVARSIREMQDFASRDVGGGFHEDTGLVGFRSDDNYAADGQCGTVLKAYREHLMSADGSFLARMWPRIKRALEYSISQDANADGLIENSQHNTYDINYHGANTFVGALYLAALRAGEEMAIEMGDVPFAKHVRAIYERGRAETMKRLWDGEYFTQEVNLEEHPQHQYGKGCLSDQLFGQGWAHQVGLGYLYPEEAVKSAMAAVWKYNWAPDVTPYNEDHKPFRWFISPGEAGLFTCTWPKSDYLPQGTVYKNEVWTGIEYQVAGHLIWEGMVEEGLAICRAIHDRYQPERFNPYNEVECGDHYARAMASWGVYLALAGFEYHGPKGHLGFAPRISPENFKAAFTTAQGWLVFAQQRDGDVQIEQLTVTRGRLRLTQLSFGLPEGKRVHRVSVDGVTAKTSHTVGMNGVQVQFDEAVLLEAGDTMEVRITMA